MFVTLHGERYDFHKIDIIVIEQGIHNLFESFDKKTLNGICALIKIHQNYLVLYKTQLLHLSCNRQIEAVFLLSK